MSHDITACSFAVDPLRLQPGLTADEALALGPTDPDHFWTSSSRSGWYRQLLELTLAVYPGFEPLKLLLADLTALPAQECRVTAGLLRRLLDTIAADPVPFADLNFIENDAAEIRRQVGEAQLSSRIDDDCMLAHANFFSYLLSQAAALEKGAEKGWAVVLVQLGPSDSEERLIWPPA